MAKQPTEKCISKKGTLMFVNYFGEGKPSLNNVMRYNAHVDYKTDSEEDKAMHDMIMKFWDTNKSPSAKKSPATMARKVLTDKNTEQPTGFVRYNFWTNATNVDGSNRKVNIYKANGDPVDLKGRNIGNGSIGYITGAMGMYENSGKFGVCLYFSGVQITKFVEYTGNDMTVKDEESDGFDGDFEDFDGGDDVPY